MLTLTETIDKIRAIDTDQDIILGACNRIINPEQGSLAPQDIAAEIILKYGPKLRPGDLLEALIIATAVGASVSAKPGHEITLLPVLLQAISSHYMALVKNKLVETLAKDKKSGRDTALSLLEQMAKMKL